MLLLLAMGIHWAQPPTVIAQIDLPPPFGVADMLRKCAFSWGDVHTYFGSVDNCSSWYPYSLSLLALDEVFGRSYGQALVFIAPVILSWLGVFALARAIGLSPVAAGFGAWAFALNPARQSTFGEYATGEVYAALLPWLAYWIVVAARDPGRRAKARVALAAIAFIPLSILAATPQLLVSAAVGGIAVFAIALSSWTTDKAAYRRWFLGTAGAGIIASLWWTIPNVASYAGVSFTHPVDASSVAWTFDRASLLNELRFCASWIWQYAEYNPWSIEFDANASFYASGFVAVLWLIVALFVNRDSRLSAVRALGGLSLAMLFIAKGVHGPLGQVDQALWAIPGFVAFIEPFGATMIAALGLALCAALGADALLAFGRRSRGIAIAAIAVSAAGLCWNNLAAFTGAIFHEKMNVTPGAHIVLAQEWTDAARFLQRSAEHGGVVVLPADDHYQADYDWGYRGVDILAIELFDRPVLMPGAPWWYAQSPQASSLDDLVGALVERRSPLTRRVLLDLGIRFAVVREDVHPVADGLDADAREYRSLFGTPAARFGAMDIYDLGTPIPRLAQIDGARPDDEDAASAELLRASGLSAGSERAQALLRERRPVSGSRLVTSSDVAALGANGYTPLPSLAGRTPDGPTTMRYDVVETAATDVEGTVEVGVWPREDTTYTLTTGSHVETRRVPTTRTAAWVAFHGVDLHPGHNALVLRWTPDAANTFAAFLPPRFSPDQPWRPHVNELVLTGFVARAAPKMARGVPLDTPLMDDPTVTLEDAPPQEQIGMDVEFDDAGRRLECFRGLSAGFTVHLIPSVRDCLEGIGERFTIADARHVRIDAVVPVARHSVGPPKVELVIGKTVAAPMDEAPVGAGPPPDELGDPNGLGAVVKTGATASPLVLAQTYSATWVAYDVTHAQLLGHWPAFGWSNGWSAGARETVVVFDLLSVLTLLLLVVDAAYLGLMWRRS